MYLAFDLLYLKTVRHDKSTPLCLLCLVCEYDYITSGGVLYIQSGSLMHVKLVGIRNAHTVLSNKAMHEVLSRCQL